MADIPPNRARSRTPPREGVKTSLVSVVGAAFKAAASALKQIPFGLQRRVRSRRGQLALHLPGEAEAEEAWPEPGTPAEPPPEEPSDEDTEVAFALKLRDLAVQRLAFAEKQWQKAIEKEDQEGAKKWEKKVEKAEEKVKEAKAEVKEAKEEAEDPVLRRQATGKKREFEAEQTYSVKQEEEEAEESAPGRKSFRGLERQSGVPNICWCRAMASWRVRWKEAGNDKNLTFSISKHMKQGLSEDEAVAAALAEAKAHREELVRQRKLKPPKPVTAKASGSRVRGIHCQANGNFQVQIVNPSTKTRKCGGAFKTLAEAETKAREMAKKFGLQAEGVVVPVERLSELPRFEPLGPEKGVRWRAGEKAWHAQCIVRGQNMHMRCRPKDFTEKEVEKAWKQAVAWKKRQKKMRR